jgi:ABC-2 type transport system ATP-binding protein
VHAVELAGVVKTFGSKRAVDGLDLGVPRGATYGLIGPSGAGKTTAIRMIMSILFPDSGSLRVLGEASALTAKHRIGYLPEERGVYRRMRVNAFLQYLAQLKGVPLGDAQTRAARLLTRLGLDGVGAQKCEDLSKGMLQRVQFVGAIIHQPELLILDEPFSGLDPVSVRLLREQITEEQQRGATILFSTHVMAQAEELCSQIVMIHQGRKVLDEPMSGLRRQFDRSLLRFEALEPDADLTPISALPEVLAVTPTEGGCDIRLRPGTDPAEAIRDVARTVAPARIEIARLKLEDVFIRLVVGDNTAPTAKTLREHLQGQSTGALTV